MIWICEAQFIREVTLQWVLLSGQSRHLETLNVNESDAGCPHYFLMLRPQIRCDAASIKMLSDRQYGEAWILARSASCGPTIGWCPTTD
jgi:hypothetical protein